MMISGKFIVPFPKLNNEVEYDRFLDNSEVEKLIELIKKKYKIKKEVILGAGCNGLLQNVMKLLMHTGGNLVTPFYSFGEAEYACTSYGGFTKRVFCKDYRIDFKELEKAIDKDTKCVYICNPNNPTGIYEDVDLIIDFSKRIKVPVIIDESCIEFSLKKSVLDEDYPDNIIVLRSFSKAYGLANLRIGFLVCSNEFKNYYHKNITINEVSGLAIISAIDMINKKDVMKNIKKVVTEREKLRRELKLLGIECTDSSSNILFTKTIFPLKDNISVLEVFDENDKEHYRIAIQEEDINNKFINELKKHNY